MKDTLLKEKNNESPQNDFEPLETDDNQEQKSKKNIKPKLVKYILLFIPIFLIIAGIIYFKCYHNSSNPSEDEIWQEYSALGKMDGNLKLFPNTDYFLDRRDSKYIVVNIIFHLDKNDVDKDRLINAIKILVRCHGILQSTFYKKDDNSYGIKFDPNLYPEINSTDIKESEYEKYLHDIGYDLDFPLNKLMYQVHIVTTEKSIYCLFFFHHAIYDIYSDTALTYTLNHAYLGDIDEEQLRKKDSFYASLYEYNLKLRNDKNYIKEIQNYYLNNYDLGRTFKSYNMDKDVPKPIKDPVIYHLQLSDKSLRDKIYKKFDGSLSKINFFNMICQLYTLYLYNKKEDFVPEIGYVRHGRNLTKFNYTIACFFQLSIIKYDFLKNYQKIQDKIYLNVQKLYDDVKKQFTEQKFISHYFTSFENYDYIKDAPNLTMSQLSLSEEDNFIPDYMFGKNLLKNSKAGIYYNNRDKIAQYFTPFFFQNKYTPNGIMNFIICNADRYKQESLSIISNLFFEVADAFIDGLLSNDKLIEAKKFD